MDDFHVEVTPVTYAGRRYWDWRSTTPAGRYVYGVASTLGGVAFNVEESLQHDAARAECLNFQFRT
jgi:hypothetical protein